MKVKSIGANQTEVSLAECYARVQGWRSYRQDGAYIMAEMREIGERTADRVNTYWVAV